MFVLDLHLNKIISDLQMNRCKIDWIEFGRNEAYLLALGRTSRPYSSQIILCEYSISPTTIEHRIIRAFYLPFCAKKFRYFPDYFFVEGEYSLSGRRFLRFEFLRESKNATFRKVQSLDRPGVTIFADPPFGVEVLQDLGRSVLLKNTVSRSCGSQKIPFNDLLSSNESDILLFFLFKNFPGSVKTKFICRAEDKHTTHVFDRKTRLLIIVRASRFINFYNLLSLKLRSTAILGKCNSTTPASKNSPRQLDRMDNRISLNKSKYIERGIRINNQTIRRLTITNVLNHNIFVSTFDFPSDGSQHMNFLIFKFRNMEIKPLKMMIIMKLPMARNSSFLSQNILSIENSNIYLLDRCLQTPIKAIVKV